MRLTPLLALVLVLTACTPSSDTTNSTPPPDTNDATSSVETSASEDISSIDDTWNLYTNKDVGYSIKIPKRVYFSIVKDPVEVVVIPDTAMNAVHVVTAQHVSEPPKKGLEPTTLEYLATYEGEYPPPSWMLITAPAKTRADIEAYVKNKFGSACSVQELVLLGYGTQRVALAGPPVEAGEPPECSAVFNEEIFFSPEKQMIVHWFSGQDDVFLGDPMGVIVYDGDMTESFRFE
jgi:hypothetical protein